MAIAANAKTYNYYMYEIDNYGQPVISTIPTGTIKISITLNMITTNQNPLFAECEYIGITNSNVNDTMAIGYENDILKVKYVINTNRHKVVYLQRVA